MLQYLLKYIMLGEDMKKYLLLILALGLVSFGCLRLYTYDKVEVYCELNEDGGVVQDKMTSGSIEYTRISSHSGKCTFISYNTDIPDEVCTRVILSGYPTVLGFPSDETWYCPYEIGEAFVCTDNLKKEGKNIEEFTIIIDQGTFHKDFDIEYERQVYIGKGGMWIGFER